MRGPGIPAGLGPTPPASNNHLPPPLSQAASATPGRAMDGLSLLPLFTDSTASLERDLLVERLTGDFVFAALRTRGYLYAEHGNGERELYDFARDRHQLESKHADPAYAAIQADLAARLDRLRTCAAETCRT